MVPALITHSRLTEVLHYDPETGVFRWLVDRRNGSRAGQIAGTNTGRGWLHFMVDGRLYKAHRLAWFYMTGSFPPEQIDHINGNRSDNRWCNLREATAQQNSVNRARPRTNTSGVHGVTYYKRNRKWGANITAHKERRFLGLFDSLEAASNARLQAEIELFGEFRRCA